MITLGDHPATRRFKFNAVFGPDDSQEDVFFEMKPLVRSVIDG